MEVGGRGGGAVIAGYKVVGEKDHVLRHGLHFPGRSAPSVCSQLTLLLLYCQTLAATLPTLHRWLPRTRL